MGVLDGGGEALEDGPLRASRGWWPWSPAAGLVLGKLSPYKQTVTCPSLGSPTKPSGTDWDPEQPRFPGGRGDTACGTHWVWPCSSIK